MHSAPPFEPDSGLGHATALNRFVLPSTAVGPICAALELVALGFAPYLGSVVYHALAMPHHVEPDQLMLLVGAATAGLYLFLLQPRGGFDLDRLRAVSLYDPLSRWCLAFMFFTLASFALKIGTMFSRGGMITGFLFGAGAIAALRLAIPLALDRAFHYGVLQGRRTIFLFDGSRPPVGADPESFARGLGMLPVGRYRLPATAGHDGEPAVAELCSEIIARAREERAEEIVVVADAFRQPVIADVLDRLRVLPLRIVVVPAGSMEGPAARSRARSLRALEVHGPPLRQSERLAKRSVDVLGALILLTLLSPVLLLIALLIRLDSRGPALFRQTRIGFAGRPFLIYKFRSMHTLDNGPVVQQAQRGDPRITRIGRFLRASSLDELPQLINVLTGDMSLVGPRPHAVAHDQYYERAIPHYAWRHHALPGITGWAQVNGFRGETPTLDAMAGRVDHDLWYIANWSFWLDLRILLLTVRAVLFPRNAY